VKPEISALAAVFRNRGGVARAIQGASCAARVVLVEIWRAYNGINNGRIGLSVRRPSERSNSGFAGATGLAGFSTNRLKQISLWSSSFKKRQSLTTLTVTASGRGGPYRYALARNPSHSRLWNGWNCDGAFIDPYLVGIAPSSGDEARVFSRRLRSALAPLHGGLDTLRGGRALCELLADERIVWHFDP